MNYAELQTAIADTLMRGDLTTVIPRFIEHAESEFNRRLRVRQMIARSTAPLSGEDHIPLPPGWLEARNIQMNGDPRRRLEYVTLDRADMLRQQQVEGPVSFYTISGSQIEFIPTPPASGDVVEMTYYEKIPALSGGATTNWLLDSWSDLYLYESLKHSAPYLKDDQRTVFAELAAGILEQVRLADTQAQFSGAPLKIRTNRTFG